MNVPARLSDPLVVIGITLGVVGWVVWMPSTGVGVERAEVKMHRAGIQGLPEGATNVSYWHGGYLRNPNIFYEFDLRPVDFDEWIRSMPRMKAQESDHEGLGLEGHSSPTIGCFDFDLGKIVRLEVKDGELYESSEPESAGGWERILYNRKAQRVYYDRQTF